MNTTSNSGYDQELLPVGTPVKITGGGLFIGSPGKIAKAYRIRYGHPMYDVELSSGTRSTYHGADQLEVLQDRDARREAAIERAQREDAQREVIREDLVANTRTPNQVKAAVASLNRKLARSEQWRGQSISLYRTRAALEDGVIAVRMTEPDRTLTDQPDKVWAEGFLDVNMGAHTLYRHARRISGEGTHAAIQTYLKDGLNTYGPTPASPDSWDAK